jgi:hypothetical protein
MTSYKGIWENENVMQVRVSGTIDPTGAHTVGQVEGDAYTGCNRGNGPDFGRVFLMLNYTEKTQNT